jgi:hypothetical protein
MRLESRVVVPAATLVRRVEMGRVPITSTAKRLHPKQIRACQT